MTLWLRVLATLPKDPVQLLTLMPSPLQPLPLGVHHPLLASSGPRIRMTHKLTHRNNLRKEKGNLKADRNKA